MSGASINKKMQKAFQKVGKAMGFEYKWYRSVDYLDPFQEKNFLGKLTIGSAVDPSFQKPLGASYTQVNFFADTTNLNVGDIFVSEALNKTLVLVAKDAIATPQAIEATHKITVSRPGYSTVGEFKATPIEVAKNIPASIYEVGSGSSSSIVGEVKNSSGVHRYTIWIWLPQENIKLNDIVVDNLGNKSYVTSIEFSPVGYKLTTQSTKAGS